MTASVSDRRASASGPKFVTRNENPYVLKLYEEFLTDGPCGEQSHEYLHTLYTSRGDYRVQTQSDQTAPGFGRASASVPERAVNGHNLTLE